MCIRDSLKFVDKTGTYPPKVYDMTWYGMIYQEDDPDWPSEDTE